TGPVNLVSLDPCAFFPSFRSPSPPRCCRLPKPARRTSKRRCKHCQIKNSRQLSTKLCDKTMLICRCESTTGFVSTALLQDLGKLLFIIIRTSQRLVSSVRKNISRSSFDLRFAAAPWRVGTGAHFCQLALAWFIGSGTLTESSSATCYYRQPICANQKRLTSRFSQPLTGESNFYMTSTTVQFAAQLAIVSGR